MKFLKLISIIAAVLPYSASAEPISIHGVNATMSYDQFMKTLRSKGYKCETRLDTDGEILAAGCMINKNVGDIVKSPNELLVSCRAFNGCGLSLEEVAQLLVNANIVQYLEYELLWVSADGTPYGIYKGFGPDGDIIKVDLNVPSIAATARGQKPHPRVTITSNSVDFGN